MPRIAPVSYWHEEIGSSQECEPITRLERDEEADVVIIGGGFSGLSTALEIKKRSPQTRITVVDANRIGSGATSRNAGILIPLSAPYWFLNGALCKESARWGISELQRRYAAIAATFGHLDGGPSPANLFYSAPSLLAYAAIEEQHRRLCEFGYAGKLLDAKTTRDAIGDRARGSLKIPAFLIHPARLIRSLKTEARNIGIRILEDSRIRLPQSAGGDYVMSLERHVRLFAGTFVCTAGAWSKDLLGSRNGKTVESWMLATEPLSPEKLSELGSVNDAVVQVKPGLPFRRIHSNRLLVGSLDCSVRSIGEAPISKNPGASMERLLRENVPSALDASIHCIWRGWFHSTRAQTPVISLIETGPRIVGVSGVSGAGLVWALSMGTLLAGLINPGLESSDEKEFRTILAATRFPVRGVIEHCTRIALCALRRPWQSS